jgi:hypothetical protein
VTDTRSTDNGATGTDRGTEADGATEADRATGTDRATEADGGAEADGSAGPPGPDPTDRAREGVEHLQAAARELIAAARAALDVAEDLVDDPDMAASMAGAVGSLGDMLRNVTSAWRGTGKGSGRTGSGTSATEDQGHDRADHDAGHSGDGRDQWSESGVERITIR